MLADDLSQDFDGAHSGNSRTTPSSRVQASVDPKSYGRVRWMQMQRVCCEEAFPIDTFHRCQGDSFENPQALVQESFSHVLERDGIPAARWKAGRSRSCRMRQRYGERLRIQIANTAREPDEVEDTFAFFTSGIER